MLLTSDFLGPSLNEQASETSLQVDLGCEVLVVAVDAVDVFEGKLESFEGLCNNLFHILLSLISKLKIGRNCVNTKE